MNKERNDYYRLLLLQAKAGDNKSLDKLFDEFNRRMEKNINEYLNMYVMNNYAVKEYQN